MTDRPPPPVSLVNLPNALTVLRLILVPVFLLALFAEGGHDTTWRWIAWGIFAIAAITDRYDGHIARKRGQVTDFGKIADPIADKALTGSALIGLSMLGRPGLVGDAGHPDPGGRRHPAAVRGDPVRRDRRQPGRQGQDVRADHRHRPVHPAAAGQPVLGARSAPWRWRCC